MRGLLLPALAALLVAACSGAAAVPRASTAWRGPSGGPTAPEPGHAVRSYDLTAAPQALDLGGRRLAAWAYNGSIPGPTIRASVGDLVQVTLHNRLPAPTTIHWHGLEVPNGEDGVPGVTQDAIPPGATATYSFIAREPGTYWYHSHQESAAQVDRGLYGPLIVDDPAAPPPGNDHALVLDEWPLGLQAASPPPATSVDMDVYPLDSINGRSGPDIEPVTFAPGETVRLRLVNAGYVTHYLWFQGLPVTLAQIGGRPVAGVPATTDVIPLAAGDRVAVDFTAPAAPAWLTLADGTHQSDAIAVPLLPAGLQAGPPPARSRPPANLDVYGLAAASAQPVWPAGAWADQSATLTFSEDYQAAGGPRDPAGISYLINGHAYGAVPPLLVSQGQLVQLTLVNAGRVQHPIHLHGHTLQLLARNGATLPGALVVDTVLLEPHSSITVGFRADNPGWWMLHCHMLQHARSGMMMLLGYRGATRMAQERMGSMPE